MDQVLQELNTGKVRLETVPVSEVKPKHLLIQTQSSLLSAGTERMLLNFGKAGLIGKVRQQPDKVKEVLQKIKTDGLATTIDAVKSKLDQPIPLGYCNVGKVLAVGKDVEGFAVGDRVLSNSPHAQVVQAPKNLCVKVPDNVTDEAAVFAVLGAIGLQGVRLAQPTLGESFVVTGLGLVGLLTAQLLQAHGCRVLGIEFDNSRCKIAQSFGIETVNPGAGEDVLSAANQFSRGRGMDGVLITASTQSSEPVHQAATICRKRGRIVLVGVTGLELSRADFYEKELSFQVSCSYGPGRYDAKYEEQGHDYPIGFVRWTEQRNMEAVLDMMAQEAIDVTKLITHHVEFTEAEKAYELLEDKTALGIILNYPKQACELNKTIELNNKTVPSGKNSKVSLAFIGAGNYASRMLIPAFKNSRTASLHTIVSGQGLSGVIHGKKQGFSHASTDIQSVLDNKNINTVVIATRHNQHAKQTLLALGAGKHVFVEKPLCLTMEELESIEAVYQQLTHDTKQAPPLLMLGFNRRFSPQIQKIKNLLTPVTDAKNFVMTVNAGFIPKEHWTQDPQVGGGRLLGEACHFIDLIRFLAGSKISQASITNLSGLSEGTPKDENITVTLKFSDGSMGTVHYFANGHKEIAKERLEIFTAGKVIQLDNFRKLTAYGFKNFKKQNLWRQDKGQAACAKAFVDAIEQGKNSPISFDEITEVTRVCIELKAQLG